jgi:hypothetical protein
MDGSYAKVVDHGCHLCKQGSASWRRMKRSPEMVALEQKRYLFPYMIMHMPSS